MYYRGFSTKEQNYTLSDCTGEGLKAVLYLQNKWRCAASLIPQFGYRESLSLSDSPKLMPDRRIFDSVDLMIGLQNSDGGFASYERIRGPRILEALNPSEVFGAFRFVILQTPQLSNATPPQATS